MKKPEKPHRDAEAKGIERGTKLKADAQSYRDTKAAALGFIGLPPTADATDLAISQAVSLKRIADAMQPMNVKAEAKPPLLNAGHVRAMEDAPDIESLAGNYLNFTSDEITGAGSVSAERMAGEIRRLASAVLRKAEK